MHRSPSPVRAACPSTGVSAARPPAAEHHLRLTLDLLAARGVEVALVRPSGCDGSGRLEADVLVRPTQRSAAEAILATLGFRRRAGWGRAPHRFHVSPVLDDGQSIEWLKIDLVTDLCFGRVHEVRTESASACLDRRMPAERRDQRLAPADELVALLLHGLLDRGGLTTAQRTQLRTLAPRASRPGALAERCGRLATDPAYWSTLIEAIEHNEWDQVLSAGSRLRSELIHGHRTGTAARGLHHRVVRHLTKVCTAAADRGPLVAVVGPDGAGKSTLTAAVAAQVGMPGRVLYGGTHPAGTRHSSIPGLTTGRIVARLVVTRGRIAWHRSRGRLVILDRHPLQVRPGPDATLDARARRRRRVLGATLPRPDLLIVLDAPGATLHARRPEHDLSLLEADRARHAELLAGERILTVRIDATASPEVVASTTVKHVWAKAVPLRPALIGWSRV